MLFHDHTLYIYYIYYLSYIIYIYIYIYIYKLYGPFLCKGLNCLEATEPLWGYFYHYAPRNLWYSLDQSQMDERLRWSWSHPVVLNSCNSLLTTKFKLKWQYVKLTFWHIVLWPLTVNSSKLVLSFIWHAYNKIIKNLFPLHIFRPNDYTVES